MPSNGVRTIDLDELADLDELLGNKDGSIGRVPKSVLKQPGMIVERVYDTRADLFASTEGRRGDGALWQTKDGGFFIEDSTATVGFKDNKASAPVRLRAIGLYGTAAPEIPLASLGAGAGVSADDVAAMSAALTAAQAGFKIVGGPGLELNFGTTTWTVSSSNIKIDWRGAKIVSGATASGTNDFLFLFQGGVTANGLLTGIEFVGGEFVGVDLDMHIAKFIRTDGAKFIENRANGILLVYTDIHPSAPMVDGRPDVAQDLRLYVNYNFYAARNHGVGSDGNSGYLTNTIPGTAAMKHRWSLNFRSEQNDLRYYRQGEVWWGGDSADAKDGPFEDGSGNPRFYWASGTIIGSTVEYMGAGGVWGSAGEVDTIGIRARLCRDYGLHAEGGTGSHSGYRVVDCRNGIGAFNPTKGLAYGVGIVQITRDWPWGTSEVEMFSHKEDTNLSWGDISFTGVHFLNENPDFVGLIRFERGHRIEMTDCIGVNVIVAQSSINAGPRRLRGNRLTFNNPNLANLDAFIAIYLQSPVPVLPSEKRHDIEDNIIESTVELPAGCIAISASTPQSGTVGIKGNRVFGVGVWEVQIGYAKNSGGGTGSFLIEDNQLQSNAIYDLSISANGARANLSGNKLYSSGVPVFDGHPTFGSYQQYTLERRRGSTSFGAFHVNSNGSASGGAFSGSIAYSKYECVTGSDGAVYRADVAMTASTANDPVSGANAANWSQIGTSEAVIKDALSIAA